MKKEKKKIKPINCAEYFMLVTLVFFLSGIMLFLYCILLNIDLGNLVWYSDPLFFLGIGVTSMFMFIAQRFGNVFEKTEVKK